MGLHGILLIFRALYYHLLFYRNDLTTLQTVSCFSLTLFITYMINTAATQRSFVYSI